MKSYYSWLFDDKNYCITEKEKEKYLKAWSKEVDKNFPIGYSFETYATESTLDDGTKIFRHIGIDPAHSSIWGVDEKDVVKIKCTIIDKGFKLSDECKKGEYVKSYYGYIDFTSDKQKVGMIFFHGTLYVTCFSYDPDSYVESSRGEHVKLKVERVNE